MNRRFYSHKRLTEKQRLKIVTTYIEMVNKGIPLKEAYIKSKVSKATIYNYLKEFEDIVKSNQSKIV